MEEKHKKILNRNMNEFAGSLQLEDVLPHLMSKEIISEADYEKLGTFNTRQDKVMHFIFLLQTKGPSAFQYFFQSLETHRVYEHLVAKVEKSLLEYERTDESEIEDWQWSPMNKYQKAALDKCNESLILGLPFQAACNHFLTVGFLESNDIKFMKKLPEASAQRSVLIEYIKGKGEVAYNALLIFLQQSVPTLETKIRETERSIKKREEQLRKLVSFQLAHKRIDEYSGIPRKVNVILIGKTGNGKSATGNTIVGKDVFLEVGGIHSGTKTVQKEITIIKDCELSVMDTPGLFDTSSLSNEAIFLEFMKTAKDFAEGIHVFLFVCRSDVRFTEEEEKTFDEIEKHFGDEVFKHCLIVLTHAEDFVNTSSFENEIKSSKYLAPIYKKVHERALAVDNKDGVSLTDSSEEREKLLCTIFDVVGRNNGEAYSGSIFELTRGELKKQEKRKEVRDKINDLTFFFLIDKFLSKSVSELTSIKRCSKLNRSDVDMITKPLNDDDHELLTNNEISDFVQIYFHDHEELVDELIENKSADLKLSELIKQEASVKTDLTDTLFLHNVVKSFQKCPNEIFIKLKEGGKLSSDEIEQIRKGSLFAESIGTRQEQSDLIMKYVAMIVRAFDRRRERIELTNCIDTRCSRTIKDYFRMKTYNENKFVEDNYIKKGFIPPELHCKCLRVISSKFKSGKWDVTIEKILLQTLIDRVKTEDSILELILNALQNSVAMLSFILFLPAILVSRSLRNQQVRHVERYGEMRIRIPIPKAFYSQFCTIDCDQCAGKHMQEDFIPF